MHLLPKHYLYLSSFYFYRWLRLSKPKCTTITLFCFYIILQNASCKISKYKHASCDRIFLTEKLLKPIIKPQQPLKYKATIDVLKNHLSGLLIVKQTDSATTHFVFITELGMKMFDFSYSNHTMKADFVFEPLNKPKLIQSLLRNFEYMFLLNVINHAAGECKNNEKNFYELEKLPIEKNTIYLKTDSLTHIQNQEIFNGRKKSSKINYLFSSTTTNYAHISCKQYGLIKIYIDLAAIQ